MQTADRALLRQAGIDPAPSRAEGHPISARVPSTVSAADVTRLCSRLPRYYAVVRLLMPSGRASLFRASPTGPGPLVAAAGGMRPPRFRTKDVSTRMGSPTAQGPSHTRHSSHEMMLPSPQRKKDRHLGKASFAAQYPAHGLPCERFTSALANCRASLGAGAAG